MKKSMVFSHTEVFLEGGACWMFRWMDDWDGLWVGIGTVGEDKSAI